MCGYHNAPDVDLRKRITRLSEAKASTIVRYDVGVFNRIFGGGIATTSVNLIAGPPGAGKMLCLETLLPTPGGWTTMGNVKEGDVLFDESGNPCTVLQAHPVTLNGDAYEVEFSDGDKIVACGDHLWRTMTKQERYAAWARTPERREARRIRRNPTGGRYHTEFISPGLCPTVSTVGSVRSTADIAASLYKGSHLNHSIDRTEPLQLPDLTLAVPPYTLGVWLGDGTTGVGAYTNDDELIAAVIRSEGFRVLKKGYGATPRWSVLRLARHLRMAGVLYNKHIPQKYLRASFAQRLEILRGLMDTDGECDSRGRCGFSTSIPRLRDNFSELLASLGIKANFVERESWLYGVQHKPHWRFTFTTDLRVFHLERKSSRQHAPQRGGLEKRRFIVAVRPVPSVPMRCITVNSPSRLYLAGRGMIPTHNTTLFCELCDMILDKHTAPSDVALFIGNEQPPDELKFYAERLGVRHADRIVILDGIGGLEFPEITSAINEFKPKLIILDSLTKLVTQAGGGDDLGVLVVSHFKELSTRLNVPSLIVNQVTKGGQHAGFNNTLHEGGALFYLDKDDVTGERLLYAEKNRFGPAPQEVHLRMIEPGLPNAGKLVLDVDWYVQNDADGEWWLPFAPVRDEKRKRHVRRAEPEVVEAAEPEPDSDDVDDDSTDNDTDDNEDESVNETGEVDESGEPIF
jgi:hypothetical protein